MRSSWAKPVRLEGLPVAMLDYLEAAGMFVWAAGVLVTLFTSLPERVGLGGAGGVWGVALGWPLFLLLAWARGELGQRKR